MSESELTEHDKKGIAKKYHILVHFYWRRWTSSKKDTFTVRIRTYGESVGNKVIEHAVVNSVVDIVLVVEAKVEQVAVLADFETIQRRRDIGEGANAVVGVETGGTAAVVVAVVGAITLLVDVEAVVAAERQSLLHNVGGRGVFCDN